MFLQARELIRLQNATIPRMGIIKGDDLDQNILHIQPMEEDNMS